MDLEGVRNYCLKLKASNESFPFNEDTLVFKVLNKIFCLANLHPPASINLKCDPEQALELREEYEAVKPGYHMNKKHWNTVELDGSIRDEVVKEWINYSYNLVVNSMTRKQREELEGME